MLIDDNPKYLEEVLPFYGYELSVAVNGKEALKLLEQKFDFDIVLLDIMMPVMNGWDTLKNIRTNPLTRNLPVIIVTAVNDDRKMISGLKMGADDYIVKPFILPNLLARIEAVLRRYNTNSKASAITNVTINQLNGYNNLTEREKDVLLLVTQGKSNKEIAQELVIGITTVKTYIYSIFKKLNVKNRTQAVLVATQMNIVK